MIVLLCMWEFIEQWPCCESIPSLGLIKWIFQRVITDAWLVGARSCLPDVLQKEKHFSPQSPTQRSIVVWWAPELMRIPGKSHLCLAGSLIANCPWTGFHQSCPVLTAAFPSVYELSCFCMCLSWNMQPSLRLYPGRRQHQTEDVIRVSNSPGIVARAEHPSSHSGGDGTMQLIDADQPNTLLKQISIFHQGKKKSGNSPRWWLFALALNKQGQQSTAQEGVPREHPRRSQQGKVRDSWSRADLQRFLPTNTARGLQSPSLSQHLPASLRQGWWPLPCCH